MSFEYFLKKGIIEKIITILHWFWLRKKFIELGFPYSVWKTLEGRISRIEESLKLFEYSKNSKHAIVEIGSYMGASTFSMAEGSFIGNNQKVYAIDPHQEITGKDGNYYPNTKKQFLKNITKSKGRHLIIPIYKTSKNAVKNCKEKLGFIFIDGDHSYNQVKNDFKQWTKFLIQNGIVSFHDKQYKEVKN